MLPSISSVSANLWCFGGKPTGDGHAVVTLEPNVPWREKAPGRRGARPAMQWFGADAGLDAGLDPGDAAEPGRG